MYLESSTATPFTPEFNCWSPAKAIFSERFSAIIHSSYNPSSFFPSLLSREKDCLVKAISKSNGASKGPRGSCYASYKLSVKECQPDLKELSYWGVHYSGIQVNPHRFPNLYYCPLISAVSCQLLFQISNKYMPRKTVGHLSDFSFVQLSSTSCNILSKEASIGGRRMMAPLAPVHEGEKHKDPQDFLWYQS